MIETNVEGRGNNQTLEGLTDEDIALARGKLVHQPEIPTKLTKWHRLFILVVLVAIAVSEYLFVYQDVAFGIGVALFLALGIYAAVAVFRLSSAVADCAEALALIPLYILFTSSLPWFFINQQYLLPAVYSIILGLSLWHIYQNKLSFRKIFGFQKDKFWRYLVICLAIGTVTGTLEYLILRPAPAFPAFEVKYLLRDMVYMFLFVGVAEELMFRGLIQIDLMNVFGKIGGLLLTAITFSVMHLTWRSVPELFFVLLAGVILGALYWKTKNLALPIIVHGMNNVMLVAVMPYLLR